MFGALDFTVQFEVVVDSPVEMSRRSLETLDRYLRCSKEVDTGGPFMRSGFGHHELIRRDDWGMVAAETEKEDLGDDSEEARGGQRESSGCPGRSERFEEQQAGSRKAAGKTTHTRPGARVR